jgi:hypothetical protein
LAALFKHIFERNLGMVVSFFALRVFAVLNGFFGAPLNTGKALLAAVSPCGFPARYDNIMRGTDFYTYSTGIAFIVGTEGFIHFADMRKRLAVCP